MSVYDTLGRVVRLMAGSPIHRGWSIADVERLILPPLVLGQYTLDGHGFASWAFFDDTAAQRFVERDTRIPDWDSGSHVFLVDVIAPDGGARAVTSTVRATLREQGYGGQRIHYRRTYPGRPWRISRSLL